MPEQRAVVRNALYLHQHEVAEASDGLDGLTLAQSFQPDLILSDVQMEGVDGYTFLAQLRQDPKLSNIPVILMTGQADLGGLRHGMSLGADDYLPKPFSLQELLHAVSTRLEKQAVLRREAEKKLGDLRGQISLMLPHELLTPLSGILGIAEIIKLEASTVTPKELLDYARTLQESGERLHRLILNFLTYAQVELLATMPEALAEMRRAFVENAEEVISHRCREEAKAARREGDLKLEINSAVLPVSAANLDKIVTELVSNAFKFSKPGAAVSVHLVDLGKETRLVVMDHGRGMEPDFVAQIGAYMQFNRKVYEQQGAGLGLTIAKRLVELHGARFSVFSERGQGTTVTVIFPPKIIGDSA